MLDFLDSLYIGAAIRTRMFIDSFKKDERGVSSIVATVLLILIVVCLAAIFWNSISSWFTDMWSKITGKANTIGGPQ